MNATEASLMLAPPRVADLGMFDRFYEPWIVRATAELAELAGSDPSIANPDEFVQRALADLMQRLVAVGSRSLIWSYRQAQEPDAVLLFDDAEAGTIPLDGTGYPRARYDAHHQELSSAAGRDRLLAQLPLLAEVLDRTVRTRLQLLREVVTAARADLNVGPFGSVGRLREVRASEGDSHNDGRQVVIVVFENTSLVYKPHSLLPDRFIADLVASLNAAGDDPRDWLAVPVTLAAGDHGWQELIVHSDCATAAEVTAYYRRCGIWLTLLSAIGTSDIHFENLIAAGSMPYIVDVETLTGWAAELAGDPVKVSGLAELRDSVLSTLMLPIRFLGTAADTNLAALGTPDVQTSGFWSVRGVVARSCDGIRYLEVPSTYQHGDNLPTISGVPQPAARYGDAITAGYERGLGLVSACGRELRAVVESQAYDEMPVRQVIRATAIYAAFVDASMHPRYLADPLERRRLLMRLGVPGRLPGRTPDTILEEEIAALARGDIPFFSARLGESWIRSANGPVQVAEIEESSRDHMHANLTRHFGRAHTRDRHYIHTSLATAATDDDAGLGRWGEDVFRDDDPDTFADAVVDWIDDLSFWDADHVYCQRIGTVADGDNRTALMFGDLTYYGEGGTILFLVERARTGNAAARRLVRGSVLPSAWWPGGIEGQWNPGAFGGLAGTAYLLHEAGSVLADPAILAHRDTMVNRLRDGVRTHELGDDLIGGAAGVAIALAEATRVGVADCREEIRYLGMQLHRFARHGSTIGVAHGRMGATLARAHLVAAGIELEGVAAPFDDPDQIIRGMSETERDSWCKGVPGVVAARAAGLHLDGLAVLAQRLMGREERSLPTDISVCHGVGGEIMALVVAGRALQSRTLLAEAERRWSLLVRQVRRYGYRGGSPGACGQTGLMAGLSGLAMAGLLLKDPNLPPAYTQSWTVPEVTR